jgi:NADH dehydrogenase FAD-containing subunit
MVAVLSRGGKHSIDLPYDQLVIAVGANNATHKVKGIENVNFLSSLNGISR